MDTENSVILAAAPHNPFDSTQLVPPFAGRAEQFARLHQHLTSAAVPTALTLLGRRSIGRSAFINAARNRFDDSFVWGTPDANYLPDQSGWLRALYQAAKDAASARGLAVHRLPRWPDEKPVAEQRDWLQETGLPEIYQLIRPHRRLIFVVDGVEPLAEAIMRGTLPPDMGAWMSGLIGLQLGFVFTAHVDNEAALTHLAPLIDSESTLRIGALSAAETAELLTAGRSDADELIAKQIYALTGGLPELTLKTAAAVHDVSRGEAYSPAHLRQVRAKMASDSVPYFRMLWGNLSADEQAILTALAYLRFEHPNIPLNAEDVEAWLADSDYPLDLTAVFSVLRRLEFLEVVNGTHKDVMVRAGLFESYIRETVKPEHLRRTQSSAPAAPIDPRIVRYGVIALVVALLLLMIIAAFDNQPPSDTGNDHVVPTVTLRS